jgi:uncharacterized protein YcbX
MTATVRTLWRYPVKGLGAQALETVDLTAGAGLPGDRAYAIAQGNTPFDPLHPEWLPRDNFVTLATTPRLAALETQWDAARHILTVRRDGRQVARGDLSSPVGRAVIADFLSAYLREEVRGTPRVVFAEGHRFSDHREAVVSLINGESLRDLERVAGRALDPLRFRANVMVDGLPAWSEFDLIGRDIRLGGARLRIVQRIESCPATSADPTTGRVDLNLLQVLRKGFGHIDFGVHARVVGDGRLAVGDKVTLPDAVR